MTILIFLVTLATILFLQLTCFLQRQICWFSMIRPILPLPMRRRKCLALTLVWRKDTPYITQIFALVLNLRWRRATTSRTTFDETAPWPSYIYLAYSVLLIPIQDSEEKSCWTNLISQFLTICDTKKLKQKLFIDSFSFVQHV